MWIKLAQKFQCGIHFGKDCIVEPHFMGQDCQNDNNDGEGWSSVEQLSSDA